MNAILQRESEECVLDVPIGVNLVPAFAEKLAQHWPLCIRYFNIHVPSVVFLRKAAWPRYVKTEFLTGKVCLQQLLSPCPVHVVFDLVLYQLQKVHKCNGV